MMNRALFRNIGHYDNAIDLAGLEGLEGMKADNIKPPLSRTSIGPPLLRQMSFIHRQRLWLRDEVLA